MATQLAYAAAREFAGYIADGCFSDLIKLCSHSRLTQDDIQNVVLDYGRKFIKVPSDYENHVDVVQVMVTSSPSWSVRAPLWTMEEGRSDLIIEFTVSRCRENRSVDLDDIRVM